MSEPVRPPTYLTDANYYRLAYQLAAQQINASLDTAGPSRQHVRFEPAAEELLKDGLNSALRLQKQATVVLDWYDKRERTAKGWWPWDSRKLAPGEQRLQHFLSTTVQPCAVVLVAGALLYRGDIEPAESFVTALRSREDASNLSYRVYYNLACYDVARGEALERGDTELESDAPFERALAALRRALAGAHGRPRKELIRWAEKDPSLQPIRDDDNFAAEFANLLERYRPPEAEQPEANVHNEGDAPGLQGK
jgi:hypothetical protein